MPAGTREAFEVLWAGALDDCCSAGLSLVSVGLFDKAKALANEAVNASKRVADVVVDHVESVGERNDRVEKLIEKSKTGVAKGRRATEHAIESASEHEAGRMAGSAVRKIGSVISDVPILSAAIDGIRSANCVDLLAQTLKSNPNDKYANLWLAEGILKSSEDVKRYQVLRGAFEPSSLLLVAAAKQVSEFGRGELPSHEKLLRRAWLIASRELKARPRSTDALDVLARVQLAKGKETHAAEIASAAVVADPNNPITRITLSRALLASGETEKAILWARSSIECGSSLGYAIEARARQELSVNSQDSTVATRVKEYELLMAKIKRADRIAYHGAYRDSAEILKALREEQFDKTKELWSRAKKTISKPGEKHG